MNSQQPMNHRANALAERLEFGAKNLVEFADGLSSAEWQTPVHGDGRTVGVIVHHVASAYPIEIELAQILAAGNPITEVTQEAVDQMNAKHAQDYASVGKQETLDLLHSNSKVAADAVRAFDDEKLDKAAPVSLNANAPLSAQFFIEDHALRHSFHHLARIKAVLEK